MQVIVTWLLDIRLRFAIIADCFLLHMYCKFYSYDYVQLILTKPAVHASSSWHNWFQCDEYTVAQLWMLLLLIKQILFVVITPLVSAVWAKLGWRTEHQRLGKWLWISCNYLLNRQVSIDLARTVFIKLYLLKDKIHVSLLLYCYPTVCNETILSWPYCLSPLA